MEGGLTIATIITTIGSIVTGIVGWFGDILTFVVGNPLLLFIVLLPIASGLVYSAIKLVKRGGGRRKRAA